MLLRQTEQPAY